MVARIQAVKLYRQGKDISAESIGKKRIIGLTFPTDNRLGVGLEPSLLSVLPPGDNVSFYLQPPQVDDAEVGLYLCSVYIAGMNEFTRWAADHDAHKIVVGGYHPTMFPEKFLGFAEKIVVGPCNNIWATLGQPGVVFGTSFFDQRRDLPLGLNPDTLDPIIEPQDSLKLFNDVSRRPDNTRFVDGKFLDNAPEGRLFVKDRIIPGILDPAYPYLPRYDLHDIRTNYQVGPTMRPGDIFTSINTSYGCKYSCNFCCTPVMYRSGLTAKPLEAIEREVNVLKGFNPNYIFIRDENPTLLRDIEARLRLIAQTGAQIYMFASANTLTDRIVAMLKRNNVYMVCLGLEDPTEAYGKNKNIKEAIGRLKKNGIMTYLSFIVDPLKIVDAAKGAAFYNLLMARFRELKPEMVCGNFLMPFPGTEMWDKYYHLVSEKYFSQYDSKTPFLIGNEIVAAKMKYYMFYYQWLYYTSSFYRDNIRRFDTNDTLHLRFVELKRYFDDLMDQVKEIRP